MTRRSTQLLAAAALLGGVVAGLSTVADATGAPQFAGIWSNGTQIQGSSHVSNVSTLSCEGKWTCAGGGSPSLLTDFSLSEVDGSWAALSHLPGLEKLNKGGTDSLMTVSCGAPRSCTAGGTYATRSTSLVQQGFVDSEVRGKWRRAIPLPGLAGLNSGGDAQVTAVSCPTAGFCGAVGTYAYAPGDLTAGFVASKVDGRWRVPVKVVGTGRLHHDEMDAISCPSRGNCTAVGFESYMDERDGTWGPATPIPGLRALDTADTSLTTSVSCASVGDCSAAGFYGSGSAYLAFVVDETHGAWGDATSVPGLNALNIGQDASVSSISCASAGNCAAGGFFYGTNSNSALGFVVAEVGGVWQTVIPESGGATQSVSCASAGNCAAVGGFGAINELGGVWQAALVPAAPDGTFLGMDAVSCSRTGYCSAVGDDQGLFGISEVLPS